MPRLRRYAAVALIALISVLAVTANARAAGGIATTVIGAQGTGFQRRRRARRRGTTQPRIMSAVAPNSDLYVADSGNQRIRKIAASEGTITTVAGTGTVGYTGDGGPATDAELSFPLSIAVGEDGTVYWVEFNNAVVRKLDPQGVISTVAARGATPTGAPTVDGPATSVWLGAVYGMDVDAAGSVYIAIASNGRIRKVTNGVITTVAGGGPSAARVADGGPATDAHLESPVGVAVDDDGSFYLSDYGQHTFAVRETDQAGNTGAPSSSTFTVPTELPRGCARRGPRPCSHSACR